jgi:hypothetical protein
MELRHLSYLATVAEELRCMRGGDSAVLSGERDLPLREAPPGSVLCRWRASRSSPTT